MKHYRRHHSGTSRVKKVMFRILFVLIAAAVITFSAILTGNYLQRKVDALEQKEESTSPAETAAEPEFSPEHHTHTSPSVFGAALSDENFRRKPQETPEQQAQTLMAEIARLTEAYDTLLFPVTDTDGHLLYPSPAVCTLARMPQPAENPIFTLLCSAAAACRASQIRLCAVMTPTQNTSSPEEAAVIDGTIMQELALEGFNEILLTLPDADTLQPADVSKLCRYIRNCRTYAGEDCAVGIVLPDTRYLDASFAKQIQMLAAASSFLAISFPDIPGQTDTEAYEYVSDSIPALLGSFNVYNMRIVLDGEHAVLAAKYQACQDNAMHNLCFTSAVLPSELIYSPDAAEQTPPPVVHTPLAEDTRNPYICDYSTDETAQSPETVPPTADERPEPSAAPTESTSPSADTSPSWY